MGKKTHLISPEIMYAERGDFVMCSKCEEWELIFAGEWYWDYDEEQVYCDKCWVLKWELL